MGRVVTFTAVYPPLPAVRGCGLWSLLLPPPPPPHILILSGRKDVPTPGGTVKVACGETKTREPLWYPAGMQIRSWFAAQLWSSRVDPPVHGAEHARQTVFAVPVQLLRMY